MGQGLWCYDCIWFAHCHHCMGVSCSLLCCNFWLCVPERLMAVRRIGSLNIGGCSNGCGMSCCCSGYYCCIPEWLKKYSLRISIGDFSGPLGELQIIGAGEKAQPVKYYQF